jgi:hypothetical protein
MKVMKRATLFISVVAIILISVIFLPGERYAVHSWTGDRDVPSHHGYAAIDPSKNHFVVVGDTRQKPQILARKPRTSEDILMKS